MFTRDEIERIMEEVDIQFQTEGLKDQVYEKGIVWDMDKVEKVLGRTLDVEELSNVLNDEYEFDVKRFIRESGVADYTEGNVHHIPYLYVRTYEEDGQLVGDVDVDYQ